MDERKKNKIKIGLVDDHALFRNALSKLIPIFSDSENSYEIMLEAQNGIELLEKMKTGLVPDILLLDIQMPKMDGFAALSFIAGRYPEVLVLMLSMHNDPNMKLAAIQKGANGYLNKNVEADELKKALTTVLKDGYYLTPDLTKILTGKVRQQFLEMERIDHQKPTRITLDNDQLEYIVPLTEKEKEFLRYLCSELTYKDIAEKMFVSPRTIDNYRDSLFEKLNVKTRVGLILYAIRNQLLEIA